MTGRQRPINGAVDPGKRARIATALSYALAIGWAVVALFPMYWLLTSSLKSNFELFSSPWGFPETFRFSNYVNAWRTARIGTYTLNSVYLTIGSLVLGLLLAVPAAYPLVRLNGRVSRSLYRLFVFGIVIPVNSALIPLFIMFVRLRLVDTYLGLLLFYTATNVPFNVFLLYGFLHSFPPALEEAGLIDGASLAQIIGRIVLPVMQPALATAAVLSFLNKWNELLFALTFVSSQPRRTLPAGLTYFTDMFATDYGPLLAAVVVSIIPVLVFYVALQNNIVTGLTAGALKS